MKTLQAITLIVCFIMLNVAITNAANKTQNNSSLGGVAVIAADAMPTWDI